MILSLSRWTRPATEAWRYALFLNRAGRTARCESAEDGNDDSETFCVGGELGYVLTASRVGPRAERQTAQEATIRHNDGFMPSAR